MTNSLYTSMFKDIAERASLVNIETPVITLHTAANNKNKFNVSGNIKIDYTQSQSEAPNYTSIINSRRELLENKLGTNFITYILSLINSTDLFVNPLTNDQISKSSVVQHITQVTSENNLKYTQSFDYDYYTHAKEYKNNPIQAWNLLAGRELNEAIAKRIIAFVVIKLNEAIDYILKTNLQEPDKQFAAIISSMFTPQSIDEKITKTYDYTHFTLLLPALVQYLMSKNCCLSANDMIGHIAKNSYIYPVLTGTYAADSKFISATKSFKNTAKFTANEAHINTQSNKQLITSYYYNYPFKDAEHNLSKQNDVALTQQQIDSTLSTIPIKYDSTASLNSVSDVTFDILSNDDTQRSITARNTPFKMKVFESDVRGVTSEGVTYDYYFNDYFELDGYMERPYWFSELTTLLIVVKNDPNTSKKLVTATVSGEWSKNGYGKKDNCGHYHSRGLNTLTYHTVQSHTDGNLLIYKSSDNVNGDRRFRVPRYYSYKSSFWCTTWHDTEPDPNPATFKKTIGWYSYAVDADPDRRIFNDAANAYPKYTRSSCNYNFNNISKNRTEKYCIPVYKLRPKFTRLITDAKHKVFQTGNWYKDTTTTYTSQRYVRYSDCTHQLFRVSNGQIFNVTPSVGGNEQVLAEEPLNYFIQFNNIKILPPTKCKSASSSHFAIAFDTESAFNDLKVSIPEPYVANMSIDTKLQSTRNDTVTLFKTVNDIYYFNNNTFNYWYYELMKSKSLQQIINDIRSSVAECPELVIMQRIRSQLIPGIGIKSNQIATSSYIDLPIGPTYVTLANAKGIFKHNRYAASITYKPLVENENNTCTPLTASNVVANQISIPSDAVTGNVLDDYVYQILLACAKVGSLSSPNDAVLVKIPAKGSTISDIIGERSKLFGGKCVIRDSLQNPNLGIDEVTNSRFPHILLAKSEINSILSDVYQKIAVLHVPTFDVSYNDKNGDVHILFDSLEEDSDNILHVYCTQSSKCPGSFYSISALESAVNSTGQLISYVTINYNGNEFAGISQFLRKRQ